MYYALRFYKKFPFEVFWVKEDFRKGWTYIPTKAGSCAGDGVFMVIHHTVYPYLFLYFWKLQS